MKTIFAASGLFAILGLSASACGGGDGGSASGAGGSNSGSGGASAAGMSTSGASGKAGSPSAGSTSGGSSTGTGGAGTSGSGNTGGSNADLACSPGKTTRADFAYPDPIQNCGFDGKGELAGVDGFFRSIKLAEPIGPGDTFSFSVGLGDLGLGTMELWGGTGECGEAHEHFATVSIPEGGGTGSRCMTAAPKTGTYPFLIWVLHTAGGHGDVTLCPNVACPSE